MEFLICQPNFEHINSSQIADRFLSTTSYPVSFNYPLGIFCTHTMEYLRPLKIYYVKIQLNKVLYSTALNWQYLLKLLILNNVRDIIAVFIVELNFIYWYLLLKIPSFNFYYISMLFMQEMFFLRLSACIHISLNG